LDIPLIYRLTVNMGEKGVRVVYDVGYLVH